MLARAWAVALLSTCSLAFRSDPSKFPANYVSLRGKLATRSTASVPEENKEAAEVLSPYGPVDWAQWNNTFKEKVASEWANLLKGEELLFKLGCKHMHAEDIDKAITSHRDQVSVTGKDEARQKAQVVVVTHIARQCQATTSKMLASCKVFCTTAHITQVKNAGGSVSTKAAGDCTAACETFRSAQYTGCSAMVGDLNMVYTNDIRRHKDVRACRTKYCKDYPHFWVLPKISIAQGGSGTLTSSRASVWKEFRDNKQVKAADKNRQNPIYVKMEVEAQVSTFQTFCKESKCANDKVVSACKSAADLKIGGQTARFLLKCYESWESRVYGQPFANACKASISAGELTADSDATAFVKNACFNPKKQDLAKLDIMKTGAQDDDNVLSLQKCVMSLTQAFVAADVTTCTEGQKQICVDECSKQCQVENMSECIVSVKQENPHKETEWCADFWDLIVKAQKVPHARFISPYEDNAQLGKSKSWKFTDDIKIGDF